jgi:hypothetical protein
MNAGRDVERLIAGWLEEEAEGRAPDRVLDGARRSIATTGQRRLVVAWREPMYVSPLRLAGLAAAFAVAIAGAAWFGRVTAPAGVGGEPTSTPAASVPAPSPESSQAAMHDYRTTRNEICTRYADELNPLKEQITGLYDTATPAATRAAGIQTLSHIADRLDALIGELRTIPAPPAVAADHVAYLARFQDAVSLIRQELVQLAAGHLAEAQALDLATDPLSRQQEAFENKYGLAACP